MGEGGSKDGEIVAIDEALGSVGLPERQRGGGLVGVMPVFYAPRGELSDDAFGAPVAW